MSNSSWLHKLQYPRLPCPSLSPGVCLNSCTLSRWYHLTISSYHHFLFLSSIFPRIRVFTNEASSGHVAKVLKLQLQHQYFQLIFRTDFLYVWLVWTPCCPRDSQESSLVPQFKGINSLALSLFYCPALISIPDYWKNHNFDYTRPLSAKYVSAF